MLKTALYHNIEPFKGTPLGGFASQLAGLCAYSVPIKGHPKLKGAHKQSPPVTYCLDSLSSTVNRYVDKCSFCNGEDGTKSKKFYQRVTSCKLGKSYGECVEAKDVSTAECIIAIGTRLSKDDFINVKKWG